jgi:hypothetical protein
MKESPEARGAICELRNRARRASRLTRMADEAASTTRRQMVVDVLRECVHPPPPPHRLTLVRAESVDNAVAQGIRDRTDP